MIISIMTSAEDTQTGQQDFAKAAGIRDPVSHFLFGMSSNQVLAHGSNPSRSVNCEESELGTP